MGFPFETIKGERSRDKLMGQILQFFTASGHKAPVVKQAPAKKTTATASKSKKNSKKKKSKKSSKKKRR